MAHHPHGTGELDVYSYTVSNIKSDEPEGIVLPSAGNTGMFFTLELGVLIVGFGLWAGKRAIMTERTAVNHHGQ
ncbi:hypothetical protein [Bifidobacterium magnum]|uniref:Uncharacterized protein n=1 Tax=Bifidobacterium magnum TaxID=1692 RepID=A0A087BBF7_9BIFI|nr:hypothetical protein [Bifidobacterium magnum]KFI68357.1 hypothetical protein BMAGN_0318 [Bifidobacterium magnum]